jgi:nicotinamidase-related amidase
MATLQLAAATTALVAIDLQRGILTRQTTPHSAADVLKRSAQIADACRKAGALVVLVRVAFSPDQRDRLIPPADDMAAATSQMPPDFADLAPELGPKPGDLVITKRQWNAFYGTELDLQLRRRGIRTLIFTGIATNIGVESSARAAYEHGYAQVFAEDAMSTVIPGGHEFTMKYIFARMGFVRSTADVVAALG